MTLPSITRWRPFARALPVPALLAALAVGLPATGHAAGGWQTHIRTKEFTDLLVTDQEVWCATSEAGLLRFDRASHGFSFVQREPGSIASNNLTALTYDRLGRLWVGTAGSGASRLAVDGTTWDLVNAFDGLPSDSVTTFTVAGDTLWIGTRGGIALWDGRRVQGSLPDGNTVSFDTTFPLPAITGIAQLGDTLYLATPRGVGFARTVTNLGDWRKVNNGLASLDVQRMVSDGRTLYALANGIVYRYDATSQTWTSIGFIGIVYNLTVERGTVLASTSVGLWRHRAGSPLFNQITGSPIAGTGTGNEGEAGVDPADTQHYVATAKNTGDPAPSLWEQDVASGTWAHYQPPGPPGNRYANIVLDGTRVYAATRNEGIGRWDGSSWYAWLPVVCSGACPNAFKVPNEVFAMSVDRLGHKWVACWRFAIDTFDDSVDPPLFGHYWYTASDEPSTRHTLAFGAATDSSGGAGGHWFGMDTDNLGVVLPYGLDYYDSLGTYTGTWSPGSPATSLVRNGKVRAVSVDKTGRVWIGYAGASNSGVDHFVRRPEIGYDVKTVPNTTSFDVWSIVAHGDSIWVLTDRDLRRIGRTNGRLANLSYETPAGRPLGMRLMDVSPNGDVWVGSEEGVRHYRTDGTTEDFTEANSPLASNEVRAIAVDRATGVVWFGTAAGLNRYDPHYTPPAPPPGAPDTLKVFPNPAWLTGAGLQMRLEGASAGYTGAIYDLNGRTLRRFVTTARGEVFWDGRDYNGVLVDPGIYFVRAEGGGRVARARFILLR